MPVSASDILDTLKNKGLTLATAESCTGGMIAAALTDIAGSSRVFECGFITYSNQSKTDLLGVNQEILEHHGAVSAETAAAMAAGALKNSAADMAVSVTGIAGPDGGSVEKPVGLVYIGFAAKKIEPRTYKFISDGDRAAIRYQTVQQTFETIFKFIHHEGHKV